MLPLPPLGLTTQSLHGSKSDLSRLSAAKAIRKGNISDTVGVEEGWEDGEDLGFEDQDSDLSKGHDGERSDGTAESDDGSSTAEDDGGEGSWLHGRFPRYVLRA